ncbi:MAG: hypothetical protein MI920_31550 [Kiloniellales bacterium]|nr:hypothetical protein [Kiloniellales bacterium]
MRLIALCFVIAGLSTAAFAGPYDGKRILHIDSYHQGNTWNDRIAAAVESTLEGTGIELKVIRMDTKRNPSEEFKTAAALRVKDLIAEFKPDVVTASDDNAAKYLIMPHYKDAALPFVFCGLNWDASVYGLPFSNVTGMVEVSPIPQIIRLLKGYAKGERIGYLTEDTLTKRKELDYHRKLFGIEYDQVYLVSTFEDWKAAFLRAQEEVDMLVILGVAALTDFDNEAARELAESETKIPTGTDFGWLMHLSMLGVGKVPEEQGRWAARAALKILDGVAPSQIPLTYNKEGKLFFNRKIAARLGVVDYPPLAEVVP